MKKSLLTLTFLISFFTVSAQLQFDALNITLLSTYDDPAVMPESVYGIRYQGVWGWTDPGSGREYGVIGSTAGTYILEVTDPSVPVLRDYVPHYQTDLIWHEYKTYGNYLYIISDDGGNNTLQICDLSTLPDSVTVVHDNSSIFVHAHTLYIDGNKLYVGSVSTNTDFSSMNVYSLDNPASPTLLRRLDQDYPFIGHVHDMFVVNDTVFASCGYDGLFIYHYDSVANDFTQIGSLLNYPDQGYNHSSFISSDHSTLYMCDEVPDGMAVKVVDVTDISNPTVVDTFYSNTGATAHNPYVLGDLLIIAYYQDGLWVYDISDPQAPVMTGYFDTHPQNPPGSYPGPAYQGCWGAYTDLPSGTILASDMQLGLFCLDISGATGVEEAAGNNFSLYPNPAGNFVRIRMNKSGADQEITVTDITGREVSVGAVMDGDGFILDTRSLTPGMYVINLTGDKSFSGRKLVISSEK
jgi:choice-of-anchor B domain-containing protein